MGTMKTLSEIQALLHSHFAELKKRFNVSSLSIFGSYARNEQKANSDIDILVEYSESVSLFELVDTELYLSDLLGLKVDLLLKRSVHAQIRDSVLKEAIPI